MTDQQKNQRITALSRCGGVCEVCGKPYFRGIKENENIEFI